MMITNNDSMAPRKPLGLYLHVPFCIRKCNYCDFLSFGNVAGEVQEAYFRTLIHEIKLNGKVYNNKYYVDSIFVGGGTPSLVGERLIADMMTAVRDSFPIAGNAEITIESNPRTLTKSKLETYLEAGFNRLSIGVQSLENKLLHSLGRVHSRDDFLMNYALARECGFRNINIDLMFGIPDQTMEQWNCTLKAAMELEPEHISFYSLQLEEGTTFFTMLQEGSLHQVDDDLDRCMYHAAVKTLMENGYLHYEISNAAKEGLACRHNLKYWSMEDYLGLGIGSHSFLDGIRFSNTTDLEQYIRIGTGAAPDNFNGTENPFNVWRHRNTPEENISEYIFTGMRKISGIELADFRDRFGTDMESIYGDVLKKYQKNGLIETVQGNLRFTKRGLDISNTVLAEFV